MTADRPFSTDEYRGRLRRTQTALAAAGLDACVAIAPDHLYYLAGYDAHTQFSLQALIFGREGNAIFVYRDVDRENAEDGSWIADQRVYHHGRDDPVALIADAVAEFAGTNGGVGVGWNTYALPGAAALRLAQALAPRRLTDAGAVIETVRLVKSAQELAYIREAAECAEAGLARLRRAARPGMTEIELAGEVEAALRASGSEYPAMPTWLATGTRTRGSHRTPTARKLAPGEPIKTEFAGVRRRYHAVTMQTLWMGEPGAEERRAYNVTLASLRAGCREVKVGARAAKAEEAAFAVLGAAGFDAAALARFGYGVSAAFPPTWLDGLDITGGSGATFPANCSMVLHTSALKGAHSYLLGGAYVLTESGLECLSGGDLELQVL